LNFLMHIYLSKGYPREMVGNFLGDFVKGNIQDISINDRYLKLGIILHRKIDSFSEKNDIFKKSKSRFPKELYRFSGILVDVVYDHFLAKNFKTIENQELDIFLQDFYRNLSKVRIDTFIKKEKILLIKRIVSENWLYRYKDKFFIQECIKGLSKRIKRENRLKDSILYLDKYYSLLERDFFIFLPTVQKFVAQTKIDLL